MLQIVEKDNGRSLELRQGESLRLTLAENATTGYRWEIDHYDAAVIEALASEAHYPTGTIGSAGEVTFNFRSKRAGRGEIALKYWRHWEGEASVRQRFLLYLHVLP